MEFITEGLIKIWHEEPLLEKIISVLVLIGFAYLVIRGRFITRCSKCGGRFKKIHPDSTIWERITDEMTPEWQHERIRNPGVYECQNCQHRTKHLRDEIP